MKTAVCFAAMLLGLASMTPAGESAPAATVNPLHSARASALQWLALTDSGNYADSWTSAAGLFQAAVPKATWEQQLTAVRTPLGALVKRTEASSEFQKTMPGAPDGEYVVFQFRAEFANKKNGVETVTTMKDRDGAWKVAGYFIR